MSEKFIEPSESDSIYGTILAPGFNTEVAAALAGLNQMGSSYLKIHHESSSAKSSSPIQLKAISSASIYTDRSSNTYSEEVLVALAALRSLDGTTARLRSQLNRVLNAVYCQRLLERSQSIPFSIEMPKCS